MEGGYSPGNSAKSGRPETPFPALFFMYFAENFSSVVRQKRQFLITIKTGRPVKSLITCIGAFPLAYCHGSTTLSLGPDVTRTLTDESESEDFNILYIYNIAYYTVNGISIEVMISSL